MKQLMMMAVATIALTAAALPQANAVATSLEPLVRLALNENAAKKLGITAEQTAQLKALPDERAAMKALQEKVRKSADRQAELLKAEKIDEAAVMAAFDEVWAARKDVAKLQTKRIIAIRGILTDEQITKARDVMKEMRTSRQRKPRAAKAKPTTDAK